MSCSNETHRSSDHSHSHHDHDHDDPNRGEQYTLYKHIDVESIRALNEKFPNSAKKIFKTWDERFDQSHILESDVDESSVKLKGISILGGPSESSPMKMKAFINREDIDFDTCESIKADQEWDLVENDNLSLLEYETRVSKFTSLRNLTLYFSENNGAETTKISYIGLKGEFKVLNKDPIITVYELAANPADHKIKSSLLDQADSSIQ
ncbi:hypothetical protein HK099_004827 [Clydaea vesicula]|uniref:PITH domain-containing protein n=1 Tax=Clydaea vesicula TaxID=447962 RepID=A0AAD5XXZ6_9FUNG|nr:hypothetical protein HK099_004827 [Clydaea vesicula]